MDLIPINQKYEDPVGFIPLTKVRCDGIGKKLIDYS
jgi:hypothetical protein